MRGLTPILLLVFLTPSACGRLDAAEPVNHRRPGSEVELKAWLENMAWHHRFSTSEIEAATGLSTREITAALKRFGIRSDNRPPRRRGSPLKVLPYPGGRHPRIGFLDGAIRPQRETKVSVFPPWEDASGDGPADYFVVDVPEAIWSNLGLTYLAHTHIPTIWTSQGVALKKLEWNRRANGTFDIRRKLPNGIAFEARVEPKPDHVRMHLWLTNGTGETLTGLKVQNCVMLKGARGFARQTNENKLTVRPWMACRSDDGKRWVLTAWRPCFRPWANTRCPCLHSDPIFPDCPPGRTRWVTGWLSFYEGDDVRGEIKRIDASGWWRREPPREGGK